MTIEEYFRNNGWDIAFTDQRPARKGEFYPFDDMGLSAKSINALNGFEQGIYKHQKLAVSHYLDGKNVVITTPTASGKSLIFQVSAIEALSHNSSARIAAIYPLKALATEQRERWANILGHSQVDAQVGRIDGGINVNERPKILKSSRVVVMTPDIIHAWLFYNIQTPPVIDFIKNLSLIILDEAHTYSGVFGSNSAYLLRRLLHANKKLGGNARFIASSATMSDPREHLAKLTGEDFEVVGADMDTSERSKLEILFVEPPEKDDPLSILSDLIHFGATETDHQSITFVDSRKQTEYVASIIDRKLQAEGEQDELDLNSLKELQVYPYRSGYEEADRNQIQRQLANGHLKGVVSTSALEMGIDLPYLTLGILYGLPRSATSYFQRIGRVGRKKDGVVVVINNGAVNTEAIFREPERIKNLPLVQSALYLHNPRIQYIHAMCLARSHGEDEILNAKIGKAANQFESPLTLPQDFLKVCQSERIGELSMEFQNMKSQAGDDPYHTFPLRDLDVQFKVELRRGPTKDNLGTLSFGQVIRESYPGAVYYYQTRAYRVTRVKISQRTIEVRPEKKYFTTPNLLPTLILPNLSSDNIYTNLRYGDMSVIECGMQIQEAVVGFKEKRGPNQLDVEYPLNPELGCYFDASRFARYYFTTGVIFDHPALSNKNVKTDDIARILFESFLMTVPFEPQDISFGSNKHRSTRDRFKEGDKFVCIYDQTYGSLRLTSKLIEIDVLKRVFENAVDIAKNDPQLQLNFDSFNALESMMECARETAEEVSLIDTADIGDQYIPVIFPGSYGIDIERDNDEFLVESVFYSPRLGGLAYKGKHALEKRRAELENRYHGQVTVIVKAQSIRPLEGISKLGYYDVDTDELIEKLPEAGEF